MIRAPWIIDDNTNDNYSDELVEQDISDIIATYEKTVLIGISSGIAAFKVTGLIKLLSDGVDFFVKETKRIKVPSGK